MCDTFTKYLSTADVAAALGVGESSVKRWVDAGELVAEKTPGGHRRIALSDLYAYLRKTGKQLAAPEAIGIEPDTSGQPLKTPAEICRSSLQDGDGLRLDSTLHALRLSGTAPAAIIDRVLYPAFQAVRAVCHHPSEECLVLHRAIEMVQTSLRAAMAPDEPLTPALRPRVVFADIGYEVDGIPTYLAEASVWDQATCLQLGTNVPSQVIEGALDAFRADILWLSASGTVRRGSLSRVFQSIETKAKRCGVKTVVFGDAVPRPTAGATTRLGSFGEFRGFVTALAG